MVTIPLFSWPQRVGTSPPWLGLTGWDFDGLFWLYPLGFVNVTITQITEGRWSQPVDPTGHFWDLSKWTSHPNQSFDWLGLFVHVFFIISFILLKRAARTPPGLHNGAKASRLLEADLLTNRWLNQNEIVWKTIYQSFLNSYRRFDFCLVALLNYLSLKGYQIRLFWVL